MYSRRFSLNSTLYFVTYSRWALLRVTWIHVLKRSPLFSEHEHAQETWGVKYNSPCFVQPRCIRQERTQKRGVRMKENSSAPHSNWMLNSGSHHLSVTRCAGNHYSIHIEGILSKSVDYKKKPNHTTTKPQQTTYVRERCEGLPPEGNAPPGSVDTLLGARLFSCFSSLLSLLLK